MSLTRRGTGRPDHTQEVLGKAADDTVHTLPLAPEGEQVEVKIGALAPGSLVVSGGSINIASGSVHISRNTYGSVTLFDYERIGPGSILTGSWVPVKSYKTKTLSFYSTIIGTCIIDVSPVGTDKARIYWTDRIGPGSFLTASLTESFNIMRGKINTGAAGSCDMFFSGMVI